MWSCVDKGYDGTDSKDEYIGDPSFFAIRIYDTADGSSPFTRSSDRLDSDMDDLTDEFDTEKYIFNKGLDAERAIYGEKIETADNDPHHFAIFFKEDGSKSRNILLRSVVKGPDEYDYDDDGKTDHSGYTGYHVLYSGPVEDDLLEKENGTIVVVLNASDKLVEAMENTWSLDGFKSLLGPSSDMLFFEKGDKKYHTMSSSMVIKNGDVLPASNGQLVFYNTPEEAIEHETNYQMFVERLQAKYTLLFQEDDNNIYYFDPEEATKVNDGFNYHPSDNIIFESTSPLFNHKKRNNETTLRYVKEYNRSTIDKDIIDNSIEEDTENNFIEKGNWKINFTGWGLNALEKQSYLLKNISPSVIYFTNWNKENYAEFRNFWAEDASYKTGTYPDQFRKIDDLIAGQKSDNDYSSLIDNATLSYFNYPQLAIKQIHQYSPESTYDVSIFPAEKYKNFTEAYDDLAYLRYGTHLIITAQLLIEGLDDTDVYGCSEFDSAGLSISGQNIAEDKYFMNDIYWTKDAYKEYVAEYLAYWMLTDSNQEKVNFGPNNGIFYTDTEGTIASANDFEIVPAHIKGGDGMVWMKPKTGVTLYAYNPDADNPEAEEDSYTKITEEKFKKLSEDHREYWAKHYNQGRMYYPVQVRHNIGADLSGTGDFGSVRNHWYYFTVSEILSPGAPVDKPEQPIIPNPEPEENGLGVNIKILDWKRINTTVEGILDQNHSQDSKD